MPNIIVNIVNAVLASKVITQHLPFYLSGIFPLSFGLGSIMFKYFNFKLSKKYLPLLILIYLLFEGVFVFNANLYLCIFTNIILGFVIVVINSISNINNKTSWIWLPLSFALGRVLGGFSGVNDFRFVYYSQVLIAFIWLLLLKTKKQITLPTHINIKKKNVSNIEHILLICLNISLITVVNYIFNLDFHQKTFVVATILLISNLLGILINLKINYFLKKPFNLILIYFYLVILIIIYLITKDITLGIFTILNIITLVSSILATIKSKLKFNVFYIISFIQLISGIAFNINIYSTWFLMFLILFCLIIVKIFNQIKRFNN